jgi:hypothetical protein
MTLQIPRTWEAVRRARLSSAVVPLDRLDKIDPSDP